MKREVCRVAVLALFLLTARATPAQHADITKHPFEVGGQVGLVRIGPVETIATIDSGLVVRVDQFNEVYASIGGRFGYNLNPYFSIEAEANYIPKRNFSEVEQSRKAQFLAGVKAGIRKETFGIFAKARPGVMYVSRMPSHTQCVNPTPRTISCVEESQTNFAMDVGGVFEYYPTPRTILRIDAGDTIVRFKEAGPTRIFTSSLFTPATTTHGLQLSFGVTFRF